MSQSILVRARGIYDGKEGFLSQADALLICGSRIAEIGRYDELHVSHPEAEIRDLSSCWLFPGLINTHVHLEFDASARARLNHIEAPEGVRLVQAAHFAENMLQSGVTTLRDAGSTWGLLDIRHPQMASYTQLPGMQLAGPPITVTGGHLHFLGEEVDGTQNMVRAVRLRQKKGCDAIKIVVTGGQMTPGSVAERVSIQTEEICAMVDEAHRLNLKTFAHCLTTEGFVRCMNGGIDCIEHVACFVRNQSNMLLERVYEEERMSTFGGESRMFMMGLACGYHNLDDYRSGETPCGPNEAFWLEQEERMFDIFKKCIALGLRPVCGTDAGTTGTNFDETWLELALMVERGGLSAAEAIRVGTQNSAACLGLEKEIGSITPGYRADLIALAENPLENIRALRCVDQVICGGKWINHL